MEFIESISQIVEQIKSNKIQNEAQVTQSIVNRVIAHLDWDIYDTDLVKPQYNINNNFIDIALFIGEDSPEILVEVKAIGKAKQHDEQLLKYAFSTGAPMAILTDGQEWHFYLPGEKGDLGERKFYKLDITERSPNESVEILSKYLNFNNVRSGSALDHARNDLNNRKKTSKVIESLPLAFNKIISEPDELFIEMLANKVADLCGHEPSKSQIISFLQRQNGPPDLIGKDSPAPSPPEPELHGQLYLHFNNHEIKSKTKIGILEHLLNLIINEYPNAVAEIRHETSTYKRNLISTDKNKLFQDPSLVKKHSKKLVKGYWLGANLSAVQIEKNLEIIRKCLKRNYSVRIFKYKIK